MILWTGECRYHFDSALFSVGNKRKKVESKHRKKVKTDEDEEDEEAEDMFEKRHCSFGFS